MLKNIYRILCSGVLCLLALSCNKADLQILYAKQQDNIDKYIAAQVKADADLVVERLNGVYRITRKEGDAEGGGLASGGQVSFFYATYIITGANGPTNSSLVATNDPQTAADAKFDIDESAFELLTVDYPGDLIDGLRYGLEGVKTNGEYEILFTGKYGFGTKQLGNIPANSAIAYKIRITEVK